MLPTSLSSLSTKHAPKESSELGPKRKKISGSESGDDRQSSVGDEGEIDTALPGSHRRSKRVKAPPPSRGLEYVADAGKPRKPGKKQKGAWVGYCLQNDVGEEMGIDEAPLEVVSSLLGVCLSSLTYPQANNFRRPVADKPRKERGRSRRK